MLYYLELATEDLILPAVAIGFILAFMYVFYEQRGRRTLFYAMIAGIAASAVMAYLKNKTSLIDTSLWNSRIFGLFVIVLVVFLILLFLSRKKGADGKQARLIRILLAVETFLLLFYELPDVISYPYIAYVNNQTVMSTDYLYNIIGLAGAVGLCVVLGLAANMAGRRLEKRLLALLTAIVLIVNGVYSTLGFFQVALTKRWITSNHTLFTMVKFYSNRRNVFLYCALLVCLIMCIILWIRSTRVREPYSNPAQHRKIRAKWRNIRRWSTTAAVCFALAVLNLTVVHAYNNREVELSPIEDSEVKDDAVYVSLDKLQDGHLHRFAYTEEDGTEIRFIAIMKTGGNSYGVGLDACEICGETGYYEKDGQVVCKLCDVVMNIDTIGFPGGCNPIVIDYSVENGYIVVPIEGLVEYEDEFK